MRPFISKEVPSTQYPELRTENLPTNRANTGYSLLGTGYCFTKRISLLPPIANSAVHRNHIRVTHLLQIIRSQRRPEAAATVEHNFRPQIRHAGLDVALDDALTQMDRARQVIFGEFALLAH